MTQTMPELSTDPKIRKGQFRTMAREAMAADRWSRSDPVAKVVSLLERVYAAGNQQDDRRRAPPTGDDPVPWDAIPIRAKDILRYAVHYRAHWDKILGGSLVVLLDGARKVVPRDAQGEATYPFRGVRTWMGLWEARDDQLQLLDRVEIDWPAASASALVKLGIFAEYGGEDEPSAYLTAKGIATFEEAVRQGTLRD